MNKYYTTDYNKILEEERKNLEGIRTTNQDAINKTYDEQAKNTQNTFDSAVNNTETKYESNYERNAVQKLINEKMIAERNANLGLTDSGLNRAQQTAVQMSYANQKGALDIAKQGALDELSQNLALSLSNIEQNRVTALADLDANIEAQAQSNAINRYNADIASRSSYYTAPSSVYDGMYSDVEQQDVFLWYYTGTFDKNGNPIFSNSEGKKQAFGKGINPYTGENNQIYVITDENGNMVTRDESVLKSNGTDTQKAAAYYGVCENGYQPKGVIINGEKQGTIKAYDLIPVDNQITGKKQNVWYTEESGKYWIWYGEGNTYVEVKLIEGKWTVI